MPVYPCPSAACAPPTRMSLMPVLPDMPSLLSRSRSVRVILACVRLFLRHVTLPGSRCYVGRETPSSGLSLGYRHALSSFFPCWSSAVPSTDLLVSFFCQEILSWPPKAIVLRVCVFKTLFPFPPSWIKTKKAFPLFNLVS